MKALLKYLINKLNDFADWVIYQAQRHPDVSYSEYQDLLKQRAEITRVK